MADPAQGADADPSFAHGRESPTRYNAPFELDEIGERVGYPLFMKPFDGGQWVGVSRVGDAGELHARYDESGERMMHLQAAVEDFDVFARSLSIGAETMVMRFEPDSADARPLPGRARVPPARPRLGRSSRSLGS